MIAHNVYFTLHDRSDLAKAKLLAACKKYLVKHPGVAFFAVGTLAEGLDRPVNDLGFDVALNIVFADLASHDQYQVAPLHNQFIEEEKANWAQVRVFDAEVEGA